MATIKRTLHSLPAALLVLLFIYAATSKLLDLEKFRVELYRQVFSEPVAAVLLYVLLGSELMTAGLIICTRTELAGLRMSLVLILLFTGYIILALLNFWVNVPCSCGGLLSHLSWGAHLVFNCVFLCLNLIAINIYFKERRDLTETIV